MRVRVSGIVGLLTALAIASGCGSVGSPDKSPQVLRLATTTSVRDSGLLEELIPEFEQEQGCRVDVVAVGTGAALKLGEAGDADVLIVHAPAAERKFLEEGFGKSRHEIMTNHFVILGPKNDPAEVRNQPETSILPAVKEANTKFVSRGDESGTHKREQLIWSQSGGQLTWENYIESGQGMGATLTMADEMNAYVLSDYGTWLKFRKKIDLVVLAKFSEPNIYSVVTINPENQRHIETELAMQFVKYLKSDKVSTLIENYQVEGEQLFWPLRTQEPAQSLTPAAIKSLD